jgi:Ran GTPase-activating protein (RanGAP) involved in mRNA processing and transport
MNNFSNFRLGDDYIKSLSSSLMIVDHLSQINLANNRLSDKGAIPLFETFNLNSSLNRKIMILNLSYNKLGKDAIIKLCDFIKSNECVLEHINLEANSLGNELVIMVIDGIIDNLFGRLRYINFGQNNIDDRAAPALAQLVERGESLQAVILYWNQIRNYAASLIVSKIKKHQYMKFFDISWNLVGDCLVDTELTKIAETQNTLNVELKRLNNAGPNGKKLNVIKNSISAFAKELGELFKERNCGLIHLDISHNNIGSNDAAYICQEVKNNHSILGIHCDGNDLTIDELGFLTPIDTNGKDNQKFSHYANSQIYYRIDEDHSLIKTNILNVRRIRGKNHCWICEGWREIKFHYKPSRHYGDKNNLNVKLHLNFENYKAYDTMLHDDQFICYRMCPPGELLFYFTVDGAPADNSSQQITHKVDVHVHVKIVFNPENRR